MLERMKLYEVKHHKSGKPFSDLQRLTLFYNWQRRNALCAIAQLEAVSRNNPGLRLTIVQAEIKIHEILSDLTAEYNRDRQALCLHKPETQEV
jgi:hypothetical protein